MKKIFSIMIALVLALGCFAVAEPMTDLDAANAKIAELQALVEKYKPFYDAQIVATYGEDGVVWLEDAQAEYESMEAQYSQYGISLAQIGMEAMAKQGIVEGAVQDGVLLDKAIELGFDQFDEATLADLEAEAAGMMDTYVDYYISFYYADVAEITDEIRAEAEAYWTNNGITLESTVESLKQSAMYDALDEYVTKDVAITEEDVQAAYQAKVEANKADFADDYNYNSDRNAGEAIAWHPEGYRAVKHVLVKFDDEQAARYAELQNQIETLNVEIEAIENPDEEAAETTWETAEETAAPRDIETINAEILACSAEMETLHAQLLPRAQEVIDAFNAGTAFDELILKYNEDPGMQNEPTATEGYAVAATSTTWDPAFTEGAMSIANVGEISAPVYGQNGIHIIYYMKDITSGEVGLEAIREAIETEALSAKKTDTYNAQVAQWVSEANVQYFYSNFGVTLEG